MSQLAKLRRPTLVEPVTTLTFTSGHSNSCQVPFRILCWITFYCQRRRFLRHSWSTSAHPAQCVDCIESDRWVQYPDRNNPVALSYAESCIQYVKHPSKLKGLYPVIGSLGSHLDSALVVQAWVFKALRVSPFASTGKVWTQMVTDVSVFMLIFC